VSRKNLNVIKLFLSHLDKRHHFTKNAIDIEKVQADVAGGKETVQLQTVLQGI
jgi:hypothetical protein